MALSGKTVTAGPEVMEGLVTTYRFSVIDGPGVVRAFFTMENPTASPKTITVQRGVNLSFQDTVHTTSSGDATFGVDDRWLVATGAGSCNGSPKTVDTMVAGANPVASIWFSAGGGPAVEVTDDLLPVGHPSEGNAFAFDPESGRWTLNLGTKTFTAPGTYTVTVEAGVPSYVINPTCRGQFVRLP